MTQRAKAKKTAGGEARAETPGRAVAAKMAPRRNKSAAPGAASEALKTAKTAEPAPAKRRTVPARGAAPTAAGAERSAPAMVTAERITLLEAEAQALRQQLAAAQQRISKLEKRQELVVNRIDWVIDSLHNLLEGED